VTTPDPFATTPSPDGSGTPAGAEPWAQAAPPVAPQPDYRTYDYGAGAPGGAEANPAPGFSQGDYAGMAAPVPTAAYGGYPTTPQPTTDGVSIAALVTGILGLAIVPTVLGAIGLRRTAQGQRKGTWMAVTGFVLGVLSTIAWVAWSTWALVAAFAIFESDGFQSGIESGLEGSDTVFSGANTYGDDPELDALWDACAAGDNVACDDLYSQSPFGSEYEAFGDTCGERGRPEDQLWCDTSTTG
jgi:hypothetical protein